MMSHETRRGVTGTCGNIEVHLLSFCMFLSDTNLSKTDCVCADCLTDRGLCMGLVGVVVVIGHAEGR